MPLLFSYGTLQLEDVQRSTFGRVLSGQKDDLPKYEQAQVVAGKSRHANVVFNGRSDSRVSGTVFEVTDAELARADEYEQPAKYVRIVVTLASGKQSWVYVDSRSVKGISPARYGLAIAAVICFGIAAGALSHHREGASYVVPIVIGVLGGLAALGAWKIR